jgi:NAD(P)-dependent dehydrogenase (short-subunit alcohol dehydrogenase family)
VAPDYFGQPRRDLPDRQSGAEVDVRGRLWPNRQRASNVAPAAPPNFDHRVASTGGVLTFTRALGRELGKHGIAVNAVAPG